MKRNIIAAVVGGIIIFFWQFLSNAALDLHRPAQQYTPKQDSILGYLQSQLQPGSYFLPTSPETATAEEEQKMMSEADGKPWAIVELHAAWNNNDMMTNMIRTLLVDMIMVYLFIWLLARGGTPSFSTILLSSLAVGLISFLTFPYSHFIWYKSRDIWAHLADGLAGWGAAGLWLGWYLNRK
jgi:hypothetical protein